MTLIERETKSPAEKKPASLRQAMADVERFLVVVSGVRHFNPPTLRSHEIFKAVEAARAMQAEEAKLRRIIDGLAKPATPKEIAERIVMLRHAYPGRDDWDAAAWAYQLREDIEDLKPSLYQLERAMKEARQTLKFTPSIAEVLPLFEPKCLAAWAAKTPPLADLIQDALRVATCRRELESIPRHTSAVFKSAKGLTAPNTLEECAAMCSVPGFDPSSPRLDLNDDERKVAKQIAEDLIAGTYNRSSPLKLRAAALHLVHEQLKGE